MTKLVVIVQCANSMHRCSGLNCTRAFYERIGKFTDYDEDTKYMTFDCGGCSGIEVAAKMEHLTKHLYKMNLAKEDVVVHLSSCIVSENYHRTPCLFRKEIAKIITRLGYKIVLGSYISQKAEERRQLGIYKSF